MADFSTEWECPEFDSIPSLAGIAIYRLPGMDDTMLRKLLQESYRDFCRRSGALRTWRKIERHPGVFRYPVSPIVSGEIDCVTRVRVGARGFFHDEKHWRVENDPPELVIDFREHDIFCEGGHGVHHAEMWVEAVEIPHIGEERAPREFLRRYGDAIANGAMVRAMTMAGRAWTDAEQARQCGTAYENAVTEAKLRCLNGGPASNCGNGFGLNLGGMV